MKTYEESKIKRIRANESEDVAHLALVPDGVSEQLLCGILEENGIAYMRKVRSRASSILIGIAESGIDIYVSRPCLERARELYEAYCCSEEIELSETNNEED